MLSIMQLFEPIGISKYEFIKAIQNRDFLLTININDYKKSTDNGVELLTPQEFVERYMNP